MMSFSWYRGLNRRGGLTAALGVIACLTLILAAAASAAEPATLHLDPTVTPGETTLEISGTIDTHGEGTTEVYVQTSTDGGSTWEYHVVELVPAGTTGNNPFTSTIQNLQFNTTYALRLSAYNYETGEETEPEPSAPPYVEATTLPRGPKPPAIAREEVAEVSGSEATLSAQITPERDETTYEFEYIAEEAFGSEEWESSAVERSGSRGPLPADSEEHEVTYALSLVPGVAYLWRVTAENSVGTAHGATWTVGTLASGEFHPGPCPNEAVRLGAGSLLPNCRAYEQATPADKSGVGIQGQDNFLVGSSESGDPRVAALSSTGTGFPAGGGGRQELTQILYSSAGGSWSAQRLLPPESAASQAQYLGVSPNLRFALVGFDEAPFKAPKKWGMEMIDTTTGEITSVVPSQAEETGPETFLPDAIGNDGSWVIFESRTVLAAGAISGVTNLYRWDRAGGSISLVGVLPADEGGGAPAAGAFGGAYDWTEGEPYLGGATAHQYVQPMHATTADGGQVYFTAGESAQLYLRRGLTGGTASTLRVSKRNPGVEDPFVEEERFGEPFPAAFQEATPNGSKAFFTSREKLTADAATGERDGGRDLYLFDLASDRLVDVTGGLETVDNPNGAKVVALLGASADGSSGFFVAEGRLAAGATNGARNIYHFEEEGGAYHFSFVATLGTANLEARNWSLWTYRYEAGYNVSEARESRVTPDGETVLFSSYSSLTHYNNGGCGFSGEAREPCKELFLYSAANPEVICISCDSTGQRPLGQAELTAKGIGGSSIQQVEAIPMASLTANLSEEGTRVFFQTPDSLIGRDKNGETCRFLLNRTGIRRGNPTCMDVYEWEAPGTQGGECARPEVDGGCLYLLSTGEGEDPSGFADASADGSNAYILTASPLVPSDRDDLYDIYDARTGGGLASQFASPAAPCEGEGCRSSAAGPPTGSSPGSSSFVGPGNEVQASTSCKKGYVKHHRKCVKKQKKKKKKSQKKKKKQKGQKKKNMADAWRSDGRVGSNQGGQK